MKLCIDNFLIWIHLGHEINHSNSKQIKNKKHLPSVFRGTLGKQCGPMNRHCAHTIFLHFSLPLGRPYPHIPVLLPSTHRLPPPARLHSPPPLRRRAGPSSNGGSAQGRRRGPLLRSSGRWRRGAAAATGVDRAASGDFLFIQKFLCWVLR